MKLQLGGLSRKDFITLASVASATASMALSLRGEYGLAAAAIALSVVFDFADGAMARGSKAGEDEFGKQLDSLADIFAFGAAPVVLVLAQNVSFLGAAGAGVFAAAGVIRLARFNLQAEKGVFYGLPIPAAGLIVAFSSVLLAHYVAIAALFLCGLMMVSNVRLQKILK